MRKLKKIVRRGQLNKGDRVFRVNHMVGPYSAHADWNGGEDFHATVLRSHPDPRKIVVRFDYDQSIRAVDWRRIYKAD